MLIRITKNLIDIAEYKRSFNGKVFEVKETMEGKYNPSQNNIKVIEVKGNRVCVLNGEYEVIKA